jgi:excinuclease ABC subunit A
MDKPDVDSIEGLSPAISIDQKSTSHNPRSTIGTITEIYDYLRLLFARVGHSHCPACGREIQNLSKEQIFENIKKYIQNGLKSKKQIRVLILSPLIKDKKGEFDKILSQIRQKGFSKARIDNHLVELEEEIFLIKTNKHSIEAVIDRLSINNKEILDDKRLLSDIEAALSLSNGEVILCEVLDAEFSFPKNPKEMKDSLFSEKFACPYCNISLPQVEPRSFSFNSPHGACATCSGIGELPKIDQDLIFSVNLTIDEGGILPFAKMFENNTWYSRIIKTVCVENKINTKIITSRLTDSEKQILLYGTKDKVYTVGGRNRQGDETEIHEIFSGIIPELERRYKETESEFMRYEIEKYMRKELCPTCGGTRLKKEALSYTIDNLNIVDVTAKSIDDSSRWLTGLIDAKLTEKEAKISKPILKELGYRIKFLIDVGLGYLTLNRSAVSLSGGEAQRIRLASQIGTGLSGILYVLDEPSIGLHQRDNKKLINTLCNLRDLGNSIVVVEHDRETMLFADYLIDFGPGAGELGGNIIAQGTPIEVMNSPKSVTGPYLSGKRKINFINPYQERKFQPQNNSVADKITIAGAKEHNLKNITVEFPLGRFICVTGVSGSGKSTLINDILYHYLAGKFYPMHKDRPGLCDYIAGDENIDKVVMVDQSPIGRTPRSNPATYTGCFSYIRELFARTKDARVKGYDIGRFSFNVKGGRCETCQGEGQIKIEMQFLPDVYVTCESCQGTRYNQGTLEIQYRHKNISQILEMTVDDAMVFFGENPQIQKKLQALADVGLTYIKLGQPATQLSGGEAQRIKLASELSKKGKGKTVYLLDEPTTGLHFADLEKLIYVLRSLVDNGNTVIVIEHNLDLIKNSDWIIDLGPEGGDSGGEVVATGTPEQITNTKLSYTGKYLRDIL